MGKITWITGIILALGIPQAIGKPTQAVPLQASDASPTSTSASATSSGMSPLLAGALADFLAKKGGSDPENAGLNDITDSLLGKGSRHAAAGFRGMPAAAPMALGMSMYISIGESETN
jgi:hypothetical protein